MSRPWIAQAEEQEKPKYESGYRPYRAAGQPGDWLTY
jgi:hypothetical protein